MYIIYLNLLQPLFFLMLNLYHLLSAGASLNWLLGPSGVTLSTFTLYVVSTCWALVMLIAAQWPMPLGFSIGHRWEYTCLKSEKKICSH